MRSLIRTALIALFAAVGMVGFLAAQAPPPIPALPDTARITTYSISASTCACSVGFAIYGDGTDVDNWIEVRIGTTKYLSTDPNFGWVLSSPTGSLGTIPRPISDGLLTFNSAQTGTVTIVGARRPRRISQFSENRGVPARDLNQVVTDTIAVLRETWDKLNGAVLGQPGEVLGRMPPAATRANQVLAFDGAGNPTVTAVPASIPSGQVSGPASSVSGDLATWCNTLGTLLCDTATLGVPHGGTGATTLAAHGVLIAEGVSPFVVATIGTGGRVLVDQGAGADPAFQAITGGLTCTAGGVCTVVGSQMLGTATNDAASVGNVGELIISTVAGGAPVSLINATPKTITSISLTAGDWEVTGIAGFVGNAATTVSQALAAISNTNNNAGTALAGDGTASIKNWPGAVTLFNGACGCEIFTIGPVRISLAGPATYYLVAQLVFGTNTASGFGTIRARRAR